MQKKKMRKGAKFSQADLPEDEKNVAALSTVCRYIVDCNVLQLKAHVD